MLGPFRIRNLPPRAPPPPRRLTVAMALGSSIGLRRNMPEEDGTVVSVDGDDYEMVIGQVPAAKLRYTDSDREIITVGSKQELEDRLAEPVRRVRRTPAPSGKEGTDLNISVPLRPASPAMHVFEIDPIEAAVLLWQKLDENSKSDEPVETQTGMFEMDNVVSSTTKSDDHPSTDQPEPTMKAKIAVLKERQAKQEERLASLSEKREKYFKNTAPPQLQGQEHSSHAGPAVERTTNAVSSSAAIADSNNVLTATGVMQAQMAGEQLRERLGNPGPRIDRANAVNSWASYSQPPDQLSTKPRPLSQPTGSSEWHNSHTMWALSTSNPPLKSPAAVFPKIPALPSLPLPGPSRDAEAHLSEAVHGSLLPAFYENVQASLAKLSPEMTTLADDIVTAEENAKSQSAEPQAKTSSMDDFNAETGEAAEVTLSKMVFKSIGEMTDILAKMNSQFDAQLTPKLVSERLKSKEKLLPVHRQDTVRDLFTLRRAIEEFALELAETKQTLARFENSKVFPEETNLVDFNSMTASAYSFGRLVRSMDDMIIAARRGMLPAQMEDGEPKFHTPRRLARMSYDDVWSVTISSVPASFTKNDIQALMDEVRLQRLLVPFEPREIRFREGPERSAEIVIDGIARAQETWKSLVSAPSRSLPPLSERQVNLARKHYPSVYRCSKAPVKESSNAPPAPPSRADIDVARLKALQDRRAAWRKEFKARTQSVRFTETAKIIDDVPAADKEKPSQPPSERAGTRPTPYFASYKPSRPLHRRAHDRGLKTSRSEVDLQQHVPQRSLRPVQSQTFVREKPAQASMQTSLPVQGRPATYHSIKYTPGPFPPAPPVPTTSPPPYELSQPEPKEPKANYSLPSPPHLPASWLAKGGPPALPLPPPSSTKDDKSRHPPVVSYPRLQHQASDPNFAPLPSFPALQPVRQPITVGPIEVPLPGAWPVLDSHESDSHESESSGAFFRRMMGRSPAPANEVSPISSPVLGATEPVSDPQPPVSPVSPPPCGLGRSASVKTTWMPIATPDSVVRPLRRSATVAAAPTDTSLPTKSAGGPWSRRPYSETFDGAGRRQEDQLQRPVAPQPIAPKLVFTRPNSNPPPRPPRATPPPPTGPPARPARAIPPPAPVQPTPAPQPSSQAWQVPLPSSSSPPPTNPPAPDVSAQVRWCVNQLQELGYGDMHNGGMDRLKMYAHLTAGELEATIDLIEEERLAWNEQESPSSSWEREREREI